MNIDLASVFTSRTGGKLQTEFLKLFSGNIEQSELLQNESKATLIDQQLSQKFLDRN